MKKLLLVVGFLSLAVAALSVTDAEIVKDLEFFESMETLETEDMETIQSLADDENEENDKEVSDDN